MTYLNRFSAEPIMHIAKNCGQSLYKVNFSECKHVTDEYLIGFSFYCPHLEELDLSSCVRVTDHAIMKLAQYCNLKVVSIAGCHKIR